jgi:hypothetical protein
MDIIRHDIDKFNNGTSVYKRIKRIHISSEELPKTRLGKNPSLPFTFADGTKTKRTEKRRRKSQQGILTLKNLYRIGNRKHSRCQRPL